MITKRVLAFITAIALISMMCTFTVSAAEKPTVKIGTTACEGMLIKGNYDYTGYIKEGVSIYRWYESDSFFDKGTIIKGENNRELIAGAELAGKFLTFAVVPVDINGTEGDEVCADPIMQNQGYYESFSNENLENLTTTVTAEGFARIDKDPYDSEDKVLKIYKKPKSSFKAEARLNFDDIVASSSVVDVYLSASDIEGTARLFGVYCDTYGSVLELQTDADGKLYYRGEGNLIESKQKFVQDVWHHIVISLDGDNKTVSATIDGENIINDSGTIGWRFENDSYNNIASYFLNYDNGGTVCIKNLAIMNLSGEKSAQLDAEALEEVIPDETEFDITLPVTGRNGSSIYWKTNLSEFITADGIVTRPKYGDGDKDVTLSAYVVNGSSIVKKDFLITVFEGTIPPVADNITITQNNSRPVIADYTFYDEENYDQDGTTLQWYTEEDGVLKAIDGATENIFIPTREYDGKILKVGVTPRNEVNVRGEEAFSEPYVYRYYDTQKPVADIISAKQNKEGAFEIDYTYSSPDCIKEGNSVIRWYKSSSLFGEYKQIENESEKKYTPNDYTAYYKVSVTPYDNEKTEGEEVFTEPFMYAEDISDTKKCAENAIAEISVPQSTNVNIDLPSISSGGAYYTWISSDTSVFTNEGKITRPQKDAEPVEVTLTAYATCGFNTESFEYAVIVDKYTEPPVIKDYKLSQTTRPINIEYKYSDVDGIEEGDTKYQWYVKPDANSEFMCIDGANGKMYAPPSSMDGYIFIAKITPVDDTNTIGKTYTTPEYTYVYQTPATPVAIMDKPIYGGLSITGNYVYENSDGISEGKSEYKWYMSDSLLGEYKELIGEDKIDFKHSSAYNGKYVKFSVKPKDNEGVPGETVFSTPVCISYKEPQTFDDENVMKEYIDTSQIKGGYTQISNDPTDDENKVLELTRTSKQNDQMTKVMYRVPEYKGASGMIIEANVYASSNLSGVWEMFYICDASANSHGYKLWHSSTNLYTRGGAAYINGEWKEDSSSIVSTKFTKNTWHKFKVILDYTNKMMVETSFDGEIVQTDLPFRYNVASTNIITSYIQNGATGTVYLDNLTFTPIYNAENMAKADADAINLGVNLNEVISNIKLPDTGTVNGSEIVWSTSDASVINTRGKVTRPSSSEGNKKVTLTAYIINGSDYYERKFDITVMRILTDSEIVKQDAIKLEEYDGMLTNSDILLPKKGVYGASYEWKSADETIIDNNGKVNAVNVKKDIQFEVIIKKGEYFETKKLVITVAPEYGNNLIASGGISSSSAKAGNPVSNSIDGDYTTYWRNLSSDKTPFVIMDMGKVKKVNRMYLADASKSVKFVKLSASANKNSWSDINVTKNVVNDNISIIEFDETDARYIKAYFDGDGDISINELGLFYVETDENKVAGGIDDITLSVEGKITSDFEVITKLADGTTVEWSSSDTSVISFSKSLAKVTRYANDKSVILTATAVSGGVSAQKKFTVVVKGTETNNSGGGSKGTTGGGVRSSGVVAIGAEAQATVGQQTVKSVFTDLEAVPWAVEAINKLNAMGIVNGTSETTFNPLENVTREEFAALIHRGLDFEDKEIKGRFSDVSENAWYYNPVMQLSSMEIVLGIGLDEFGVGSAITRQDMAVMIYRAATKAGAEFTGGAVEFTDYTEIDEYAKTPVELLSAVKIINGVGDGRFNPHGNATRAEAAVILARIMDYINKEG